MIANGIANIYIWVGFSIFIVIALLIDAIVMHNPKFSPNNSLRSAIGWTFVWIISALIFNLWLWWYLHATTTAANAADKALKFLTGYIIEKSLSVDNLFVFYLIFHEFKIPHKYQQRVFTYGIWSAIVMRLILIIVGSWLIAKFHWLIYVMGGFLLLTGIKMFFTRETSKHDLKNTKLYIFLKKHLHLTHEFDGHRFFTRKNNVLYATPLFLALIFIEFSDIIFAFDSIPAIFAITTDPFIVWTSNIFAILGLRALYFVLAGMIERFSLLKYAIALILIFVGTKMVISPWYPIPVSYSLSIVISTLLIFGIINVWQNKKNR